MKLVFHGGKCCGVKTIHGFSDPNGTCHALEKKSALYNDKHGGEVKSDLSFFTDEAPKETQKDRFTRLVNWCKEQRPHGLIELLLSTQPCWMTAGDDSEDGAVYSNPVYGTQIYIWRPIVEEAGFKEALTFKNSNTNRNVTLFHLVY